MADVDMSSRNVAAALLANLLALGKAYSEYITAVYCIH